MIPRELVPTPLTERRRLPPIDEHPSGGPLSWAGIRSLARYLIALGRARRGGPLTAAQHGAALRDLLESYGCVWTKLAQFLGMRRDLFPAGFCDEMSRAQDTLPGFPGAVSRSVVEEDLGAPIEELFEDFSPEPIAAASIGQIHDARLRSGGMRVAIKVRRPGIEDTVRRDLRLVGGLVKLLEFLEIIPAFAWSEMFWELRAVLMEEIDYRLEASSLRKMGQSLHGHGIHVPEVREDLSSHRVLVMEYIEGVFMSEFVSVLHSDPERAQRWCDRNGVVPENVGTLLYNSLNRQLFEDNLFHSDLHPGNILLLRDDNVAFVDFGAVGSMDAEFLENYKRYYHAISSQEFDAAVDYLLLLAPQDVDSSRIDEFRSVFRTMLEQYVVRTSVQSLSYHERSVVNASAEITRELARFGIPAEWMLLRGHRAQVTLDASLMFLIPNADYVGLTQGYWSAMGPRALTELWREGTSAQGLGAVMRLFRDSVDYLDEASSIGMEILMRRVRTFAVTVGKIAQAIDVGLRGMKWLAVFAAFTCVLLALGSPWDAPVVRVVPWAAGKPTAAWLLALLAAVLFAGKANRLSAET